MDEKREKEYIELFSDIGRAIELLEDIAIKARILKANEEFKKEYNENELMDE